MFFGNPELLERNLHSDLNILIKNVKARQDQYLTLLQYNKNLISNLGQIEQMSFFTDQVNKHKSFLTSSLSVHDKILAEQAQIKQKYVCVSSNEPTIIKLMGRVTARLLQICQASLEKAKFLDPSLSEKYNQLKATLLQNLNQSGKINIQMILQTIIEYIVEKDNKQIQRLQQIIRILINGDFDKLNQVYAPPKVQPKKLLIVPTIEKKQFRTPSTQKIKQKSKQKQIQRLSKYQQARLNVQIAKKKKNKVTKQLVSIYSTMDIAKQQLIDDLSYTNNPQEKRKRLYDQIFSRNKFNYEQIMSFQSKKDDFQQKIKQFKERMQIQSQRIQQALVVVINKQNLVNQLQQKGSSKQQKQNLRKQTKSEAGDTQMQQTEVSPDRLQKVFRRRQKKNIKVQSPRFSKQTTFTAMISTQQGFQHIKFDIKNEQVFTRSNRARLPQIPGRSSLDNRYEGRSINRNGSEKKDQKPRINIMKNVQIGTLNTSIAKNSLINDSGQKKSPRDKANQQPLFENVPTSNLNFNALNGLEFTFYTKKKVTKFNETRNNFLL